MLAAIRIPVLECARIGHKKDHSFWSAGVKRGRGPREWMDGLQFEVRLYQTGIRGIGKNIFFGATGYLICIFYFFLEKYLGLSLATKLRPSFEIWDIWGSKSTQNRQLPICMTWIGDFVLRSGQIGILSYMLYVLNLKIVAFACCGC
jgi:hypothetical protein